MTEDTIAAVATASGPAGIGIVRVSGPEALAVCGRVFRPASGRPLGTLAAGRFAYGHIVCPGKEGEPVIDEGIALVMRAPHSYTAEDVCELQCHGGSLVLRKVLSAVLAAGARLAERGEFTKRAFLNGRLDLTQAQAVMDIVSAHTEGALRAAEGHLAGHFSKKLQAMREQLLGACAHIEAVIDFPEDGVEDVVSDDIRKLIASLEEELAAMLRTAGAGRILKEGLLTAIVGRPNVGKSSLLNALLREDRAIVTEIPGTTRDSLEESAEVGGVLLRLVDTAGIRETADAVEKLGIERAKQYAQKAELVLALFDGSSPLLPEDEEMLSFLRTRKPQQVLVLRTKADLPEKLSEDALREKLRQHFGPQGGPEVISLSVRSGEGLEALAHAVHDFVYAGAGEEEERNFVTDVREEQLLRKAQRELAAAQQTLSGGFGLDCVSIDLRAALDALGNITGETAGEDVISAIFSRFCVGK